MPGGHADRTPRRNPHIPGSRQPRTVAPPAGLRPRRAHEDRDRPRRNRRRRAPLPHHRLAHRHPDPQQGLAELDRSAAGGRHRRRRRQAEAGHPSAARACRPGRRHQVQFSRRALHSGARQRPRDHGAGGGRRDRQGAARRVRHRGAEPRDRGGTGAAGARRPPGTNWSR